MCNLRQTPPPVLSIKVTEEPRVIQGAFSRQVARRLSDRYDRGPMHVISNLTTTRTRATEAEIADIAVG
jgi:hypothetical protein